MNTVPEVIVELTRGRTGCVCVTKPSCVDLGVICKTSDHIDGPLCDREKCFAEAIEVWIDSSSDNTHCFYNRSYFGSGRQCRCFGKLAVHLHFALDGV